MGCGGRKFWWGGGGGGGKGGREVGSMVSGELQEHVKK